MALNESNAVFLSIGFIVGALVAPAMGSWGSVVVGVLFALAIWGESR